MKDKTRSLRATVLVGAKVGKVDLKVIGELLARRPVELVSSIGLTLLICSAPYLFDSELFKFASIAIISTTLTTRALPKLLSKIKRAK